MTTPEESHRLIQDLRGAKHLFRPDWEKRAAAATRLGELRAAQSTGELVSVIGENLDAGLCQAAVKALGQIGGPAAVQALAGVLQDASRADLHTLAVMGLQQAGDGLAVGALIGAWAKTDGPERAAIRQALIRLGPDRTAAPLISALGHASRAVQQEAARTLQQLAGTAPRLVEALGHPDGRVREGVRTLLWQAGVPVVPTLVSALGNADAQVQQGAVEVLGSIGAPAVEALIPLALSGAEASLPACEALIKIGTPAVKPLLAAAASQPRALDLLARMQPSTRRVLGGAVVADLPILITAASLATDDDLKQGVLDAVVRLGEPAVPVLLQLLDSGDAPRSQAAKSALAAMGNKAALPLARSLQDPVTELAATQVLIGMGQAALPALFQQLESAEGADGDRITQVMCAICGTDRLTVAIQQYRYWLRFLVPVRGAGMMRGLLGEVSFQEMMSMRDSMEEPVGEYPLDPEGRELDPDPAFSIPKLQALARIAPQFALSYYWLGQWYLLLLNDVQEAIRAFEQATRGQEYLYEHRQAKAFWWLGVSYGTPSPYFDYEQSLRCFREALGRGWDDPLIYQAIQMTASEAMDRCAEQGRDPQLFLQALRTKSQALSDWAEREPKREDVAKSAGATRQGLAEVEEQYRQLGETAAFGRQRCGLLVLRAEELMSAGGAGRAVALLQPLVRAMPDDERAGAALGEALIRSGRVCEGIEQFRKTLRHAGKLQYDWLRLYEDEQVRDALDKALDDLIARRRYTDAIQFLGNWEGLVAVQDTAPEGMREALSESHGRLAFRYHKLADASDRLDAYEKAASCEETALRLWCNPYSQRNLPIAHRDAAAAYARVDQWSKAIPHLRRAVEVDPQYADGWWLLSGAYLNTGDQGNMGKCVLEAARLGHPEAQRVLLSMRR